MEAQIRTLISARIEEILALYGVKDHIEHDTIRNNVSSISYSVIEARRQAGLEDDPLCSSRDGELGCQIVETRTRGSYRLLSNSASKGPQSFKGLAWPSKKRKGKICHGQQSAWELFSVDEQLLHWPEPGASPDGYNSSW
ncbi:hypothetical protein HIM_11519 [Hirsutella minnesotensis 3608]|uniref:Uncharacterized protein n=1 Tax=Hirsutella minnesotensis 3608 TaxID=1043627 RepID=A0A0F7ZIZ6_9HYPO|nr:hypothetical protein HIM_11519 [Hirsutella minnesotensis 3608]